MKTHHQPQTEHNQPINIDFWKKIGGQIERFMSPPVLLAIVCVAAYGLQLPWLRMYMDDHVFLWTWQKLGPAGLVDYFETKRPFWGIFYQLMMPILPQNPMAYHLYAFFWRWMCSVLFWILIRKIWPEKKQLALVASLLFAVYPGELMQYISLTFGQMMLVYSAFMASLIFMVMALNTPKRFWIYTSLSILFSIINLLSMEYWYTLELARIVVIGIILFQQSPQTKTWIKKTFLHWTPYILLWIGVTIWRSFFFKYQTYDYPTYLLTELKNDPFETIRQLAILIPSDLWDVSFKAWSNAWFLPFQLDWSNMSELLALILSAVLAIPLFIFGLFTSKLRQEDENKPQTKLQVFTLAIVSLVVAGGPFWLTKLNIDPVLFNSRFTLPFIFGVSLLFAELLLTIKFKPIAYLLISLSVALAAGVQFQLATDFRRDGKANNDFLWQFIWRVPDMKPGTLILSNDPPFEYYSPYIIAAQINQVYAKESTLPDLAYGWTTPKELQRIYNTSFIPDQPVAIDYVSAYFRGSTSQVMVAQINSDSCLQIYNPEFELKNAPFASSLDDVLPLASASWITSSADGSAIMLDPAIVGEEPAHGWCYYFEKADLARQQKDWETVVQLGDEAFEHNEYPSTANERLPFIQGYAYTGDWQRAYELTIDMINIDKFTKPSLCRMWNTLSMTTPDSEEKISILQFISSDLGCE